MDHHDEEAISFLKGDSVWCSYKPWQKRLLLAMYQEKSVEPEKRRITKALHKEIKCVKYSQKDFTIYCRNAESDESSNWYIFKDHVNGFNIKGNTMQMIEKIRSFYIHRLRELTLIFHDLPQYIILWITDWFECADYFVEYEKIEIIEGVLKSIGKIKS